MIRRRKHSVAHMNSVIGPGSEFNGTFKDAAGVRVDGTFEGELTASGDVIVGPEAVVKAIIRARSLLILGKVIGDVDSQGKVEIGSTGSLEGNVKASDLTIAEGAFFNGECRMNPSGHLDSRQLQSPEEDKEGS